VSRLQAPDDLPGPFVADPSTEIDWLVLAPPPTVLDGDAPRTGRYRIGGNQVLPADDGAAPFTYSDLAVALVDEIETPKHHRTLTAVAP
jgi:uncharacterized protein